MIERDADALGGTPDDRLIRELAAVSNAVQKGLRAKLDAAEQQRDALLGRLAQIEQEMRDIADMREPATDLDDRLSQWADTLRDLRVRSTPRTQETERCIKCGEPREAHTKSGADWRNTPGCVWLGRASEGASGDE